MKSNPDCIGPNIAKQRRKASLTQDQFALHLGQLVEEDIPQKSVSAWERGITDVPSRLLLPICSVLKCSILDLLTNFDLYTAKDGHLLD